MKNIKPIFALLLAVSFIFISACSQNSSYTSEYFIEGSEEVISSNNNNKNNNNNNNNNNNTNKDNSDSDNNSDANKNEGNSMAQNPNYEIIVDNSPSTNNPTPKPTIKQDYSEKNIYLSVDNSNFKIQGRCYSSPDGIGADLTGCGFEFNAYLKGDVKLSLVAQKSQEFIAIVDGVESDIIKVSGSKTITIAKNLKEGKHNIKFYKTSQVSKCDLTTLTINGYFDETPQNNLLIEIIGDSITCGAGSVITIDYNGTKITDHKGEIENVMVAFTNKNGGSTQRFEIDNFAATDNQYSIKNSSSDQKFFSKSQYNCNLEFYNKNGSLITSVPYGTGVSYGENGYNAYAVKTARKLNADWNILSQSGATLQQMYQRYKWQYGRDENKSYIPNRKANIIVINLATNSRYSADNDYAATMKNFVTLLRNYHPNAKIIFAYGAMTNWQYENSHDGIVTTVAAMGGKSKGIYSFRFTLSRDGNDGHPSMANHERMANELVKFIKDNKLA